jgi:CheY-like chemotaxis protein
MSTVLIVEDDPTILKTVAYNLGRDGHDVLAAVDGIDGLELARSRHPDLVLLDVMLPGMSGFDVCRNPAIAFILGSIASSTIPTVAPVIATPTNSGRSGAAGPQ